MYEEKQKTIEFDAVRLKVASPESIHDWSYGEVLKPETINYRTQKPEKDGLFCERIFGPTKDWECYCGKYKRIRYKGIICDKCGVEVTRSLVRRERMGHIDLVVPVSHIWFLRGVPSKLGLVLNVSPQALERVIYFADYIILKVDEELKVDTLEQVQDEYKSKKKRIEGDFSNQVKQSKGKPDRENFIKKLEENKDKQLKELAVAFETAKKEIGEIKKLKIISESIYQDWSLKYGHIFEAGIGAEAVYNLLEEFDVEEESKLIEKSINKTTGTSHKKMMKRLKLLKSFKTNNIKPEWMILKTIPVIPPDLRPMVQLDGGRFATSDLNDLYRRVINRNNRLKKLLELNAPEVICRNEKRMLQEAVDALIDNSARHGKTVTASTGQKRMLKSLADILKGKQGRFRQNLLGKRVDYSGRSVIVVGPNLKFNECGIPKRMALELFKPFVIAELIKRERVHNVRSANRFIDTNDDEVWSILESIVKDAYVFLNRAPTLHRLGIQSFKPVLIEGKAIRLHPLVCPPFNADFDGDQMAVHVPLTDEAKKESKHIMLSSKNILKPATGDPAVAPAQDFVLGCYFLTSISESGDSKENLKYFASDIEANQAYDNGVIKLQQKIKVRFKGKIIETSIGRIIFNEIVPGKIGFVNEVTTKTKLKELTNGIIEIYGIERAVEFLDQVKDLAIKYITISGLSWGMLDLPELSEKYDVFKQAEVDAEEVQNQYDQGFLTNDERHIKVVEIWAHVKDKIVDICKQKLPRDNSVFSMMNSGARGSWGQTTQMMGMRGLMANPNGDTIELPVKASLKEGMDVLEYFITTHGARKGLSDTALRTANAGYLTRRLIDVAQEVIISEDDCGDQDGVLITNKDARAMGETLVKKVKGRVCMEEVKNNKGKVIVASGEIIDDEKARLIQKEEIEQIKIRSILSCKSRRGICAKCYGWDLGTKKLVKKGIAVGIVAAQSIGEPGTQLTMRTFHTGGVAGSGDITQGLPRVEEIFEARPVKKPAFISPIDGQAEVKLNEQTKEKIIIIRGIEIKEERVFVKNNDINKIKKKENSKVKKGDVILEKPRKIKALMDGVLKFDKVDDYRTALVFRNEKEVEREFIVPRGRDVWINDGDMVVRGDQLTDGSLDVHSLHKINGQKAVQNYIIKEIQYVYSSQGQPLNDKHIEVIIRQMFSKFVVIDPGDTTLISGEVVDKYEFYDENENAINEGKAPAFGRPVLLGITKASLSTQSFLASASFQETTRILIDAAVTGKVDHLRGLKENVIIGRLIPCGTGLSGFKWPGKAEKNKAS